MSRAGLNEEAITSTIGASDQNANAARQVNLSSFIDKHSLISHTKIIEGDGEREQQHHPAGGGSRAQLVIAEILFVEIDRQYLGGARRAALREQPDFRENA